jgi:acyl-CoA synthetase (AMP-forming)/AMP-acid ligase II
MIPHQLLYFRDIIATNAYLSPDKIGARDLRRSLTFRDWNDRSCKLANALVGLGLEKGDRIAVLAYNCLQWMEIYAAPKWMYLSSAIKRSPRIVSTRLLKSNVSN